MIYRTRPAMNTVFRVSLPDSAPHDWLLAADEALLEAERADRLLSRFRPHSDIGRINAAAGRHLVPVSGETLALLAEIVELAALTDGAFDPTVGPLMDLWRAAAAADPPAPPPAAALATARDRVGLAGLQLEPGLGSVGLLAEGMVLDLGGVGKGHGVALVARVLREHGVTSALVDGGTSSVVAIGVQPAGFAEADRPDQPFALLTLADRAAACSNVRGAGFWHAGEYLGHILDPRTGWPTHGVRAAAVAADSPVAAEVVSTGLLVGGPALLEHLATRAPDVQARLVLDESDQVVSSTNWPVAS